jgi:hypothetical protein
MMGKPKAPDSFRLLLAEMFASGQSFQKQRGRNQIPI